MRPRPHLLLSSLILVLAAALAPLALAPHALADKVHMKDGRVLEGTIVRQGEGFVFLRVKIGSLEQDQLVTTDQISRIDRDEAPKSEAGAADPAKAEKAKPAAPAADAAVNEAAPVSDAAPGSKAQARTYDATKKSLSGATRVAILDFGPPQNLQGKYGDMVGVQVSVEGFRQAIPLLEKAHADVVVVRVNSGGGALLEIPKFHTLFENEYKPRFRTVAWIESGISAAAMSPWNLEEFYFMPKASLGACTGWFGALQAVKGVQLEMILKLMEDASAMGKKDPKIMRAMQIQEPLSVDVTDTGEVIWRQDENGQYVLNHKNEIYTMNAQDAARFKFAKGIAATREELAKAMGLEEVEWVAQDATDLVDKNIRDNDAVDKHSRETLDKYEAAIKTAMGASVKELRSQQLAIARRLLAEIRRMVKINSNFEPRLGATPEWFIEQEELIKKIGQGP